MEREGSLSIFLLAICVCRFAVRCFLVRSWETFSRFVALAGGGTDVSKSGGRGPGRKSWIWRHERSQNDKERVKMSDHSGVNGIRCREEKTGLRLARYEGGGETI